MKTIIRLSNRGRKNHPYWYIVVQTSGKKNQGRCHEVVGYWLPRWTVQKQRSIVLNKHRIRYWIDSNAVMSNKVRWLLNMGGMMPKVWIPHGRSHLYERPKKIGKYIDNMKKIHTFNRKDNQGVYEARRRQDKDMTILRKIKEESLAKSELYRKSLNDIEVEIDENFQIESDIVLRSKQFLMMKDIVKYMEDNIDHLSPSKKVLLKGKMKKMMKLGVISEEEVDIREKEELDPETIKGQEVRYQQMMERLNGVANAMEQIYIDSTPISKEEAKEYLIENMDDEPFRTSRLVEDMYDIAEQTGDVITMNDIKFQLSKYGDNFQPPEDLRKFKHVDQAMPMPDFILYPPKQYLTPIPDLAAMDPADLYDMREGPSKPIDPNKLGGTWNLPPKNIREKSIEMMIESTNANPANWKSKKQYNIVADAGDPIKNKKMRDEKARLKKERKAQQG